MGILPAPARYFPWLVATLLSYCVFAQVAKVLGGGAGGGVMPWTEFVINPSAALLLSSPLGLERQIHPRLAGLRTNALVTTSSATFLALASMVA